jgi:putative two-component system response regulator
MSAIRILIVDDMETNRAILEQIIEDMGYQPVLAESGEQAIELLQEFTPHLVMSDISMPGMDGYELCRILKSNAETRDIPIIFISAYTQTEDIVRGFSLGGDDYITKPFIPEVVKARVGVHLRLYESGRQLRETNRRLQVSVNSQLSQIEKGKKNMLYALANAAAENAYFGEGHTERICKNCRTLAQGLQLSPLFEDRISDSFIDAVEIAAPLCDIGNIAIPMDILQKKNRLTEEELKIARQHTVIGAKLLGDIRTGSDYNDFMEHAIEIAQCHHENWDGSGYPEGRIGEDIPLSARITSLVSVYCALTEKRSYRESHSKDEALLMMKEDAGKKFDPDMFDIYCKIYRQLC